MGACHCYRCIVIRHELSQKLCTAQHRKALVYRLLVFLVIIMDGSRVYNNVNSGNNIRSFLSIEDGGSQFLKAVCQRRLFVVGAGDAKTFF